MKHTSFLSPFGRAVLVAALLAAALGAARAQGSAVERGRYLVTTVMACGNCHTPNDAQGQAIAGKELSGGGVVFDIPPFVGASANITPDERPCATSCRPRCIGAR